MPPRGGGRGGGRGGFNPSRGLNIGGVELNWDLTGVKIDKAPAETFPAKPPPQAPPSNARETLMVNHYLAVRDRIHDGPFYTILGDGMKTGKKRRANDPAPTETSLFNPFTDNQTYTSKYMKVRRRIPKLDMRPYVTDVQPPFFPPELLPLLDNSASGETNGAQPNKKRKTLQVAKSATAASKIDSYMNQQGQRLKDLEERGEEADEDEDEEEDDEKPDAVDEEDNWSAVSSDSEESGDDYNAEQYFDGGDDDDMAEDEGYDNSYE